MNVSTGIVEGEHIFTAYPELLHNKEWLLFRRGHYLIMRLDHPGAAVPSVVGLFGDPRRRGGGLTGGRPPSGGRHHRG